MKRLFDAISQGDTVTVRVRGKRVRGRATASTKNHWNVVTANGTVWATQFNVVGVLKG